MQTLEPSVTNNHLSSHLLLKFSSNNLPKECYFLQHNSNLLSHSSNLKHLNSRLFQSVQLPINPLKSKRKDHSGKMWSLHQAANLNLLHLRIRYPLTINSLVTRRSLSKKRRRIGTTLRTP